MTMKTRWLATGVALILCGGMMLAQTQPAQPAQPAQNGPKPKSQKEVAALMAVQNATTADARLKAIDDLLTNFADTEYKSIVLDMAVETAQQKNDLTQTTIWANRALQNNPKDYVAKLALAEGIANSTREFDLDKDEKLNKAEKYANDAIVDLKDAPKIQPNLTDEQWSSAKRDMGAQAHVALALVASVRKKYDVAASEFKAAVDTEATPNPGVIVRMGDAYEKAGKYDDAIAAFDKAIAEPTTSAQVKQVAQNLKSDAEKKKSGGAPASGATPQTTTPPAAPAPAKQP